jgi:hypothetical protein
MEQMSTNRKAILEMRYKQLQEMVMRRLCDCYWSKGRMSTNRPWGVGKIEAASENGLLDYPGDDK